MANKLKEMTKRVNEELKHIPKWPEPQGALRLIYWSRRMHSLSQKVVPKQTAKEVLEGCIACLRNDYPNFEFKYEIEFFNQQST